MTVLDGEILKAVLEIALDDGTIAQNVFYFLANFLTNETDSAVLSTMESYIEDIYGAVSAHLGDGFTINPSEGAILRFDDINDKWYTYRVLGSLTPTFTHTNTDDPFPNQVAPTMTANTNRPKTKGRKFLIGFVETSALASELIAAAVTAMGNALNHYLADETVSGSNVLSPGVPRKGVDDFKEFTDGSTSSIVGTQRRRKPGVGA